MTERQSKFTQKQEYRKHRQKAKEKELTRINIEILTILKGRRTSALYFFEALFCIFFNTKPLKNLNVHF